MRIKYFFVVLLLLSFTTAFAQFNVGVVSGLNLGNVKGDQPENGSYNTLIGTNYGLLFDLNLSEQIVLSIQPGLSHKGTKISYAVKGFPEAVDSINIKLDYFSVPLLLKVLSKGRHLYAIGGLDVGFPLSTNAEFVGNHDDKRDISAHLSDVNIVMHFGAGWRFQVGKPTLFLEARYLQGLNNIVPIEKPEYNFFPRVRTTDVQLLFGIEFPLF